MYGVALGLSFLEERGIDLVERLASGMFLSRDELSAFSERCRLRDDKSTLVVGSYSTTRYSAFFSYLEFRLGPILFRATPQRRTEIKYDLKTFQKLVKSQKPGLNSSVAPNERLGLTPEQRALLLDVIDPNSPKNPFEVRLRVRNRAMVMLLFTFGLRAGEMMGIKRIDYDNRSVPSTLSIHRRPNDKEELRPEPARAKTRARMFNIEGPVKVSLEEWIKDRAERGRFPAARKHGYIFTNEDGDPLTLRGARKIFERLRECYPELGRFCQHVLRHDVNDRLWEQGAKMGTDSAELRADAIQLMGWSEKSTRPEQYAKTAIRNRASKRILSLQEKDHTGR